MLQDGRVAMRESPLRFDRDTLQPLLLSPVVLLAVLMSFPVVAWATDVDAQLASAEEKLRGGHLEGALQQLEALLVAKDLAPSDQQRIRELAARVLHERGEGHFRAARIDECVADFNREVSLYASIAAEHWQRGIAYYYASEYEQGARQFELHQTVNPQDVENSAWHFLCVVRGPHGSVEAARRGLLPVTRDRRVPMAEILQMFAGKLPPEEVARAGEQTGGVAKFYADLYVGLYYEAIGQDNSSLRFMTAAAENPAAKDSYMGDVARVHVRLRKSAAAKANVSAPANDTPAR